MSVFAKVGKAEVFGSSRPLAHGKHAIDVKNILAHEGKGKKTTTWFIVEAVIVESEGHPAGDTRSWVVDLGQVSGPGNVKAFALAVLQCVQADATLDSLSDEQWIKFCDGLVTPAQPGKLRMVAEVFPTTTREGKDFSKHVWSGTPAGERGAALLKLLAQVKGGTVAPAVAPAPTPAVAQAVVALPEPLVAAVAQHKAANYDKGGVRTALQTWAAGNGWGALFEQALTSAFG